MVSVSGITPEAENQEIDWREAYKGLARRMKYFEQNKFKHLRTIEKVADEAYQAGDMKRFHYLYGAFVHDTFQSLTWEANRWLDAEKKLGEKL